MEVRSSRRVRTLVTQMAPRGLSANEIARALISMMARSTASNQRPDTLMQDRLPPALRIFLQRTAGQQVRPCPYAPKAEVSSHPTLNSRLVRGSNPGPPGQPSFGPA